MNILQFVSSINAGGIVGFLVLVLTLIEITPIKVSPLQWIGKRVNKIVVDKTESMEKKLNEHIAQSNRDKIFSFQNELLNGKKHTREQFDEVLGACTDYETFCEENKIKNEKCKLAIEYIEDTYKKCQAERSFLDLPKKDKKGAE